MIKVRITRSINSKACRCTPQLCSDLRLEQAIWENKGDLGDGVPHLFYVAREKSPSHHHHFKGGAMNVLVMNSNLVLPTCPLTSVAMNFGLSRIDGLDGNDPTGALVSKAMS